MDKPGRRTQNDAYEQAYYHGRYAALAHWDSKPLGPDNLIYLHELRRLAVEWVQRIDGMIRDIEDKQRRQLEARRG